MKKTFDIIHTILKPFGHNEKLHLERTIIGIHKMSISG